MIGASIGIARCPVDSTDIDTLLSRAGTALREVKGAGGAGLGFWGAAGQPAVPVDCASR